MVKTRIFFLIWLQVVSAADWAGQIVYEENFNGNSLDMTKWMYEEGCDGFGTGNLECYNRTNVAVNNGKLIITVTKEERNGKPFKSGRIRQKTPGYAYGAFVVSARLARGDHLWPAIWLFSDTNAIPCRYEEIDIAEYRGQPSQSNVVEQAAHWGRSYEAYTPSGDIFDTTFDLSKEFHEYAVLWTPTNLTWFIDKKEYFHISPLASIWTKNSSNIGCGLPPFSIPETFIFNVAVGGEFFKYFEPYDLSTWNKPNMEVDWVRVYQGDGVNVPTNHETNQLTNPPTNQASTTDSLLNKVIEKVGELMRP